MWSGIMFQRRTAVSDDTSRSIYGNYTQQPVIQIWDSHFPLQVNKETKII